MAGLVGKGKWRAACGMSLAFCLFAMWNASLRGDDAAAEIVLRSPAVPETMAGHLKELNNELGHGVPAASNAVFDLLTVFEETAVPDGCRADFYLLLGVKSVPSGPPRLAMPGWSLSLPKRDRYHYAVNPAIVAYDTSSFKKKSATWGANDHPDFFQYLERNRTALDGFAAAAKKEVYYCPVVEGSQGRSTQYFRLQSLQTTGLLLDRAMNRLHSGDLEGAIDDVLASRRLCALMAHHPTDLNEMQSIANYDLMAFQAESELIATNKLSARQVKRYIQELLKLPPSPSLAEVCARESYKFDVAIDHAKTATVSTPLDYLRFVSGLDIQVLRWPPDTDWAIARKQMNELLAAYVKVMQTPPRSAGGWEQQFWALRSSHEKLAEANSVPGPVEHRSRAAGVQLFLNHFGDNKLRCISAINSMKTRRAVSIAGLAALAYRLERRAYPTSLSALKPAYLSDIPRDGHTGRSLGYDQIYGNSPPYVFGRDDETRLWLP